MILDFRVEYSECISDDDPSADLAAADPEDMSISSDNEDLAGNVFEDLAPKNSAPNDVGESDELAPNIFEESAPNFADESGPEDDEHDFHMDIAVDPVLGNIPGTRKPLCTLCQSHNVLLDSWGSKSELSNLNAIQDLNALKVHFEWSVPVQSQLL